VGAVHGEEKAGIIALEHCFLFTHLLQMEGQPISILRQWLWEI
jgi:hypothetical protein